MTTNNSVKFMTTSQLFLRCLEIVKQSWLNLLLSFTFITVLLLAANVLLTVIYYFLIVWKFINADNLLITRMLWTLSTYLIYFLIAVIAQIIIIYTLINPKLKFRESLKSVKKHFLNFLFLSIIISVLLLIFSLPIYAAIVFFIANQAVLGFISLILGYVLILLLSSTIVFSVYIVIEEDEYPLNALRHTYSLSKDRMASLTFKIFILAVMVLILNNISGLLFKLPVIGTSLGYLFIVLIMLLVLTYPFALYQDLKRIKSA